MTNKYLLDLKLAQMQEQLKTDIEEALGTPQEQFERLERMIEACASTARRTTELRKDITVELDLSAWGKRRK